MHKKSNLYHAIICSAAISFGCLSNEDSIKSTYKGATLPLLFATEEMGLVAGAASVHHGIIQKDTTLFVMGLYSENDSAVGFTALNNLKPLDNINRLSLNMSWFGGKFTKGRYFIEGGNDSQYENSIQSLGYEQELRLELDYQLLAHAAHSKPKMSVSMTPFYKQQRLNPTHSLLQQQSQWGVEFELDYDTRNSPIDTLSGSRSQFKINYGLKSGHYSDWYTWQFLQSLFIPIKSSDFFEDETLAFNYYLADTPSWQDNPFNQPPSYAGISLGGFDRSRGYNSFRYHGRSATNYIAEYRMKPTWQPLSRLPILRNYQIDWWQWIVFAEVGRVANEFDLNTLHKNMKASIGIATRVYIEEVMVRVELAKGTEQSQVWVMLDQPF